MLRTFITFKIGFDATYSLVLLDKAQAHQPLSVSKSGRARRRRTPVARTRRAKLMWLNETYGAAWMERVGLALELVDFLTLKCTSALKRSKNSLSCKFLYQPPQAGPGWDVGFYRAIGLETLLENDATRIGARAQYPDERSGRA